VTLMDWEYRLWINDGEDIPFVNVSIICWRFELIGIDGVHTLGFAAFMGTTLYFIHVHCYMANKLFLSLSSVFSVSPISSCNFS
jgi:hypothetical protein